MLKGEVLIKFSDINGNPTKDDYRQENLIYDQTLIDLLNYRPNPLFVEIYSSGVGAKVVISTQNIAPAPNDNMLTGILAVGDNIPGETSPIWFEDITPNFGQIINQFPAPGASRTFDSVGLALLSPNNDVVPPGDVNAALTTVLLTIPCTQGASEILTIFYFIKVIDNYRKYFNARFLKDFGGSIFGIKQCTLDYLASSYTNTPSQPYNDLYFPESARLISRPPISDGTSWNTGITVSDHYKWKETREWTIANSGISGQSDQEIGRIFNSFLVGRNNTMEPKEVTPANTNYIKGAAVSERTDTAYRMQRYRPRQVSMSSGYTARIPPFQPTWGHRPGGSKPFFEPLYKERGNGGLTVAGAWADDMPNMYRIEITKDGSVGTSEYKFSKRYHIGFEGNTWTNRLNAIAFRNPNVPASVGMHGWNIEDNDLLRFSNTQIVQYDADGLTLLDLLTGAYTNFDVDSTPALPVSTLRQCAVDTTNKLIYAACRDTGLYVIDVTANTVTQIKTAPCYGVDVGVSNIAYGLFEGSLNNSSNWTVDLPISFTGLTDSNWSKCFFIKCNPSNTDKQIALIIETPGSPASRTILWYSDNLNTTNQGYSSGFLYQFPASFEVSDTDDFWSGILQDRYIFDDASQYSTSLVGAIVNFNHSVWGLIPRFGKVSFYNQYLIALDKLIDKASNQILGIPALDNYPSCVHLCGGIVCLGSWLICVLPNDEAWTSYGWDGTNWIDSNTSSKVTHATAQVLIDGLTILFSNGATAPQFLNGDFYTQSINLGTLKDNSIAIYYENFWYTKKVNFDTPVNIPITATTETFPEQSNIYWIRVETDSIDALSEFLINGTNVLKVWVDGTAPNANEITIDGITGVITFNSADIGKTLTGFYAWIENYY
jgi:hypothetical protein